MNISLLSGRLLVSRDPDDSMTASGLLHVPDGERKVSCYGEVVLHEPGWFDENLTGKRVVIEKFSWREVELDGHTWALVPEDAVLAIVEEE